MSLESRPRRISGSISRQHVTALPTIHEDPQRAASDNPTQVSHVKGTNEETSAVPSHHDPQEADQHKPYLLEIANYCSFTPEVLVNLLSTVTSTEFAKAEKGKFSTGKLRTYLVAVSGSTAVNTANPPSRKDVLAAYAAIITSRLNDLMELPMSDGKARAIAKAFALRWFHTIPHSKSGIELPFIKMTCSFDEQLALLARKSNVCGKIEAMLKEGSLS